MGNRARAEQRPDRRVVHRPRTQFDGTLDEYFESDIRPNLVIPELLRSLHLQFLAYVENPESRVFVVRTFSEVFPDEIRGVRKQWPNVPNAEVYGSDNEAALWFFARLFYGEPLELSQVIEDRAFPIGMVRERNSEWPCWGRQQPESAAFAGLMHAHLFDGKRDVPVNPLDRSNLVQRMIRLLHPMNHFIVPGRAAGIGDVSEVSGVK